jgi:hypothetical protein
MLIKAYGLFWRRGEVEWNPGTGRRFELLGRRGNRPSALRIADFRQQQGLYVLYSDYGATYVGVTHTSLGDRLKDQLDDEGEAWDRFSWFGFRKVLAGANPDGTRKLATSALTSTTPTKGAIADLEAVVSEVLGLTASGIGATFRQAELWEQVALGDDDVRSRLAR